MALDPPDSGSGLGAASLLELVINALPIVVYAFDAEGKVLLAEGRALQGMASRHRRRGGSLDLRRRRRRSRNA